MTLSNLPGPIDGAQVSSALLRRTVYASLGKDGVLGANDMKVSASTPNGQSLRVAPGIAAILNGYQTSPNELYVATNIGVHNVNSGDMPSSSPTESYWMVALVVGDPQAGYSQAGHPFMPSDFDESQANTFQYVQIVVLPCSPTANKFSDLGKSYPGLALARLDIPGSVTTITDAMITDLRTPIRPTTDVGWTDLPLNSGWTRYNGGYMPPQYKRVGNTVFLRGVLLRAAGAAGAAFTLPVGFRPPYNFNPVTRYYDGAAREGSFFVGSDGQVIPDQVVNNSTYELGNISFDVI